MQHADQIFEEIKNANNILLHCHPKPDPDSVGSALGMYFMLQALGKTATVISGDSDIMNDLSLPGVNKIQKKSFFDIDPTQFDLFIILDSAGKEMVSKKGEVVFPKTMKTIVIDHHISNKAFGDINLINPSAVSTTQILYDLCKEWDISFSKEIATNLLAGMYADSGAFSYENSSQKMFVAVAELVQHCPNFHTLFTQIREGGTTKDLLRIKGLMFDSIEHPFIGVALSAVSYDQLQQAGVDSVYATSRGIAAQLKQVPEWDIGITLLEKSPDNVSMSIRAKEKDGYDVAKTAALLGGGGHRLASGALLETSLEEAKKQVIDALKATHPHLQEALE